MGAARPGAEDPRPIDGQRLPRASRLHRATEIRGLFERGKRKRTAHLDVFFAASPASRPRLGVLVPKHRHTVVERNLLKRRLRELGRTRLLPALRAGERHVDVLVRARREAYEAAVDQLRQELDGIMEMLCSGPSSSR
jgi:ribonuclease P protein component